MERHFELELQAIREKLIAMGGLAEAMICLARSPHAADELTLVLIPRGTQGMSLRRLKAAGGEAIWEVRLDGVRVDADAIVGSFGGARRHVERLLLRGAAFKSAELIGIGDAALDLSLEYARTRMQFNKPIGSFQAVHHHCANMYRDLELSRLLAWQASGSLGAGTAVRTKTRSPSSPPRGRPGARRRGRGPFGAA